MSKQIYVNLPVKDLQRSIDFFTALGFSFNPDFTDETATCMIISDNIFVMLLTETKFKGFIPTTNICDAHQSTEVLTALSVDSREDVDAMVEKAVAGGGETFREPDDHGFMYQHAFADLDGHKWELVWMNPEGMGQ